MRGFLLGHPTPLPGRFRKRSSSEAAFVAGDRAEQAMVGVRTRSPVRDEPYGARAPADIELAGLGTEMTGRLDRSRFGEPDAQTDHLDRRRVHGRSGRPA